QASIRLEPAADQALSIQVGPYNGTGILDLTVNWTASQVSSPAIEAELVPAQGSAIPLAFTVGTGSATCRQAALPSGYYTLVLRLKDGTTPVMGAVEVARILKDQTTAGEFDFLEVTQPGGGIQVSITPRLADPLDVRLSGGATEIPVGGQMTLTASVPAE